MARKHDKKYVQLGMNIAYYRKKVGHTQETLAEKIGISRTHMSNIEAIGGDIAPSLDVVFDIADALEIEVAKLFEVR